MKRLNIALVGQGHTMERLVELLEEQGHAAIVHAHYVHVPAASDLIIEDGSASIPGDDPSALPHLPVLGVRLTVSDTPLEIVVDISFRGGVIEAPHLIEQRRVQPDSPTGNGQQWRLETLQVVEEQLTLQVARYARDPQALSEAPSLATPRSGQSRTLDWLEQLAFAHAFNETSHAGWQEAASHDLLSALHPGLLTFADRTALSLDGQRWSYRQLHALTNTLA